MKYLSLITRPKKRFYHNLKYCVKTIVVLIIISLTSSLKTSAQSGTLTFSNTSTANLGTMLYDNNGVWELLGCITWFGEITYILKVCELGPVKSYKLSNGETAICVPKFDTPFKYFDNATKTITDDGARFIYNGR